MKRWLLTILTGFISAGCFTSLSIQKQEQAVQSNPIDPQAYYLLGNAYYQSSLLDDATYDKEKLTKAMDAYKKATELNPDLGAAYGQMGLVHRDLGHQLQAMNHLEQAIRLDPNLKEEKKALAELNYNQGVEALNSFDYLKGMQSLLRATELNPKLKEAQSNLAIAYYNLATGDIGRGDFEEGIAKLKKALAIKPDYKEAENNLCVAFAKCAAVYSNHGDFEKAEELFKEAMKINNTKETTKNLALVYCKKAVTRSMKKETYSEAIDLYKKAIKLCPDKDDLLVKNAKNNIAALEQRLKRKGKK